MTTATLTLVASHAILRRRVTLVPTTDVGTADADDDRLDRLFQDGLSGPLILAILSALNEADLPAFVHDLAAPLASSADDSLHLVARTARLCLAEGETREWAAWLAAADVRLTLADVPSSAPRLTRLVIKAGLPSTVIRAVLLQKELGHSRERAGRSALSRLLFQYALRHGITHNQ